MDTPNIKTMGIGELKSFLCAKSNGNLKTCRTCPGREGCKAGKRAVELIGLSEQKAESTVSEYEKFKTACESHNAWGWLESNENLSKGQAKERLVYLINKYPALGKEYGGQKLLLRYRPLKDEPEKGTEEQKEEKPRKMEDHPEARAQAYKAKREKAIAYWTECLNSQDPVEYHMKAKGVGRATAATVVGRAKKKYAFVITENSTEKEAEAVEEISIKDFLEEVVEQQETAKEAKETEPKENKAESVTDELYGMFTKLDAEKTGLMEEIKRLEARLKAVDEKYNALTIVMNMLKENK